jgi:transposase
MFIRKTTSKRKGKTYTNHVLVESVRTPRGPRQKTICSLGDLRPRARSEWLKLAHKVEQALVGQEDLFADADDEEVEAIVSKVRKRRGHHRRTAGQRQGSEVVAVRVDEVCTEMHREVGPVHVGYEFWKRLGLDDILQEQGLSKRAQLLNCCIVLNRLIDPKPEHAIPAWLQTVAAGDLLATDFEGLSEDALYRAMDRIAPCATAIESALVEKEVELFNLDRTVLFYDLTSTYFEGLAQSNAKAKRGYSRDKRPDCKQLVVALVVNRDGFPLLHEVFEGNTQDRATLGDMLDLIDKRVGLQPGQTVVVDRGMAYPENLEQLRNHPKQLHYIVATRQSERDQWLAEFDEEEGFEEVLRKPSPRNPFQKKSLIRVKTKEADGELYALCISSERVEKDRAIRRKQEQRMLADLGRLRRRIAKGRLKKPVKIGEAIGRIKERYPRVARYYQVFFDQKQGTLSFSVRAEKHKQAEELDGSYLLRSDRTDLSAEDLWRTYILLTRAENAFRNMKSPLRLRPIHHQIERRSDTHIFLSLLAYHLLVSIEKTMLDNGVHSSWETVCEALSTHEMCTVVLPADTGEVLRIRKASTPEPLHRNIYDLLSVPVQPVSPKKIWSTPEEEM